MVVPLLAAISFVLFGQAACDDGNSLPPDASTSTADEHCTGSAEQVAKQCSGPAPEVCCTTQASASIGGTGGTGGTGAMGGSGGTGGKGGAGK